MCPWRRQLAGPFKRASTPRTAAMARLSARWVFPSARHSTCWCASSRSAVPCRTRRAVHAAKPRSPPGIPFERLRAASSALSTSETSASRRPRRHALDPTASFDGNSNRAASWCRPPPAHFHHARHIGVACSFDPPQSNPAHLHGLGDGGLAMGQAMAGGRLGCRSCLKAFIEGLTSWMGCASARRRPTASCDLSGAGSEATWGGHAHSSRARR